MVPMFRYPGVPAGFCDRDAYGKQIRNGKREDELRNMPFCGGWACPHHGGPAVPIADNMELLYRAETFQDTNRKFHQPPFQTFRVFKDGDSWCALAGENLQEGHAAFAGTPNEAAVALWPVYRPEVYGAYPCPTHPLNDGRRGTGG